MVITHSRPALSLVPAPAERPKLAEPAGLVIVDDVESLTEGTTPGCNDDNPYR
ncbi:hypothetical protein SCATT_p06590 (plasmid) [Streptantibioticus cattleyicolor NRRL 8057 = DSM 46488]|uniref:Uncharacterized protein n=1 Tax=Streptantibioticus cattleyicolor (strain ATCC 35852 / DSM 46488 / JCM 4925 / NBRC 14057 / NRRL 8057) TaxID=1003195 RepID=F8JJ56_STREN|nr:hypothetical protein SCATT_p06590 [Streptantibioticus cattleyicolor NRRL 8057 = DSM 46488]CCB72104.1 protein of unknown function [Streptantibioticus cattleyicolor NRRL 8057 = DSM 46488]